MQNFNIQNPSLKSVSFMLSVEAEVALNAFPTLKVTGDCMVYENTDHRFSGEVAEWGFSIPEKDAQHSAIMQSLSILLSADQLSELCRTVDAQLLQVAMDKVQSMWSPKQEEVKPAVDVKSLLDNINLRCIVEDALSDADIASNASVEVNHDYGNEFTIDVEFDDSALSYTIISRIEDAFADLVEWNRIKETEE